MLRMTRRQTALAFAVALLLAVSAAIVVRADDTSDAARLSEALGVREGSVVAEIGAGGGEITTMIARQVGASGRVFTTELGADRIKKLRGAVEQADAGNVTVVEGDPNRTNLPALCCDAIFMRSVYHHFADPGAMNRSLLDSLRPGGRLAVMDFRPPKAEADSPAGRDEDGHHGVTADTVVKELTEAGFERLEVEARDDHGFLVLVRKPS
jgi:predicted methyltransferase